MCASRVRYLCLVLVLALGPLAGCGDGRERYGAQLDLGATIRALGSEDLEQSSAAEDRLVALGRAALPALDAALGREPEAVRVGVVETLDAIGGDEVVPLLVRATGDPAEQVRADAIFALRAHPGPAVDAALVPALGDPSRKVRQRAAVAAGAACRSPDCADALVARALGDDDAFVAWTATTGLVRLRTEEPALAAGIDAAIRSAVPVGLAAGDAERRARAAILLAVLGDERAAPVLIPLAADGGDARLRLRAIYGLGLVGGPDAVAPLRAALGEPRTALYAHDALRRAAARGVPGADSALAGYSGPQSSDPLPLP